METLGEIVATTINVDSSVAERNYGKLMVIFPSEITMGIMNSFPFYGKIHGKIVMIFEWKFL